MRTVVIFSCKRAAAAAALLAAVSCSAIASSLAPTGPGALAGAWVLFAEGHRDEACALALSRDGRAVSPSGTCETAWLGEPVAGWASKPDGLALTGGLRHTLLMLAPVGEGRYRGKTRQGAVLWLERANATLAR